MSQGFTQNGPVYIVDNDAWNAWTPGFTGFSADPSTANYFYKLVGKICFVSIPGGSGTSNTTAFTITGLPATSGSVAQWVSIAFPQDNSSNIDKNCMGQIGASSTTLTLYLAGSDTGWTASNNKAVGATFFYETA